MSNYCGSLSSASPKPYFREKGKYRRFRSLSLTPPTVKHSIASPRQQTATTCLSTIINHKQSLPCLRFVGMLCFVLPAGVDATMIKLRFISFIENCRGLLVEGVSAAGIAGKPAFLHALLLLEYLEYAPKRGECRHAEQCRSKQVAHAYR